MFADLLTIIRVELESLGGVKGEHFIVYCLDVYVFVHRVAMRRGMTSDHFRVKFGVEYGVVPKSNNDPYRCFITLCWRKKNSSLNGGKETML